MSQILIPKRWKLKKLEDICSKITDGVHARPNYTNVGIPFISVRELKNGTINFDNCKYISETDHIELIKRCNPEFGDILLSKTGSIGRIVVIKTNQKFSLFVNTALIKPLKDKINHEYLAYTLKNYFGNKNIEKGIKTSTLSNLPLNEIKKIQIPIPSRETQKKIVHKLDYILDLLDKKKITILEKINKNINSINYLSKNLFFEFINKEIPSQKIPQNWKIVSFEEVTKRITYGFTNPMPHTHDGPWIITAKNVKNRKIEYDNANKTDLNSYNSLITDKCRPKIGTVLITKDGTLGEVAIVDKPNMCINQSVASLEPIESVIYPEFLMYALLTSSIKREIKKNKKKSTIGHIQITKLANWKFGFPDKITQKKIIRRIQKREKEFQIISQKILTINTSYDKLITYLDHLGSGILSTAFSGKLVN